MKKLSNLRTLMSIEITGLSSVLCTVTKVLSAKNDYITILGSKKSRKNFIPIIGSKLKLY